jgi:hypothetical protein
MRSTLARHIKPVNNGQATIHNFGVPADDGPSFRAFAKRWDSVWLRASSDLLSCAGSQNPKKFAVGIPTLARLRSKSKLKLKVKGDGQKCPSYMGKIKDPRPVSRNEGRDKDGAPDRTNH